METSLYLLYKALFLHALIMFKKLNFIVFWQWKAYFILFYYSLRVFFWTTLYITYANFISLFKHWKKFNGAKTQWGILVTLFQYFFFFQSLLLKSREYFFHLYSLYGDIDDLSWFWQ